ncbi:tyrosinase family protein [Catalinimonas niigatensis]|uniref:tyrosinase family protein n=1 Tax=Catalinimonas niigatensis TaxID=1397264 RepID=UPI002666F675|nr:tyrosinase family protein [Catalinimonas niigatensis]WPP50087.1 tyrosinase family protein [Catalinimonas niigatensis]
MKTIPIRILAILILWIVSSHLILAQSIRKNFTEMTQSEKDALVAAFYQLREGPDLISDLASYHNAFMAGIHKNLPQNDVFLAWHRKQMQEVELAMQTLNPRLSLPYWDETKNRTTTDPIWDESFMGQFNTAWNLNRNLGAQVSLPSSSHVSQVLALTNYYASTSTLTSMDFSPRLETQIVHTGAHLWVGGVMKAGNSPFDPIFYLHHCYMDKIWQRWQTMYGTSSFTKTSMPRYDGVFSFDGKVLPAVNPNSLVDSRSLGVFYAENQLALLDQYQVSNTYRPVEVFYYQYKIQAENNFIVPAGKSAQLESVTEVVLKPGFEARNGSTFTAKIDQDNNMNTNARSIPVALKSKPFKNVYGIDVIPDAFSEQMHDHHGSGHDGHGSDEHGQLHIFPNPAHGQVTIAYTVHEHDVEVRLTIFNHEGRIVYTKEAGKVGMGAQQFTLEGELLSSGTYVCMVTIGQNSLSKKLVVVR